MKFISTVCTEELIESLGIPVADTSFFLDPVNLPCAFEADEKILLVQYPEVYSRYPNSFFYMSICKLWIPIIKTADSIEVLANDTEEYFKQDYLINALTCSLRTIFEGNEIALKFEIRGRSDNKISPEVFLMEVEGWSKLLSESKLIENIIKPNLPRVKNVDFLIDGKLAEWNELSQDTQKLLINVIEKYRKKLIKKNSTIDIIKTLEENNDTYELLSKVKDARVLKCAAEYFSQRKNGVWFKRVFSKSLNKGSHTFIGGIPELSTHTEWPYDSQGHRAFFIGQLDCAAIGELVPNQFPENGILYFFSDQNIEKAWDVNGTKCYVFHRQLPTSIITSVPDDYPNNLAVVELVKRQEGVSLASTAPFDEALTWPKMELQGHRFTTFISSFDYISENYPDRYKTNESESLSSQLDQLLNITFDSYLKLKEIEIFGKKKIAPYSRYLFPKTIPNSINLITSSHFKCYDPNYPWTRLHIYETAHSIKLFCLEQFERVIRWSPEFAALLGLEQRYQNKLDWGYFGIKSKPDFLHLNCDINLLLEQVKVKLPSSYYELVLLLDVEILYNEAEQITQSFSKSKLQATTASERDEFVNWLSGWINYCSCFRDCNDEIGNLVKFKNYPLRCSSFEIERLEHKQHHFHFSDSLQSKCEEAFNSATKKLQNKSPELYWSICNFSPEYFNRVDPYVLGMHKSLGYGNVVQHAAYKHRSKVLLLEVQSDAIDFSNFGDGALQFWISEENLKAGNFSEAFMTAECT